MHVCVHLVLQHYLPPILDLDIPELSIALTRHARDPKPVSVSCTMSTLERTSILDECNVALASPPSGCSNVLLMHLSSYVFYMYRAVKDGYYISGMSPDSQREPRGQTGSRYKGPGVNEFKLPGRHAESKQDQSQHTRSTELFMDRSMSFRKGTQSRLL